jgi:hypothetical protein
MAHEPRTYATASAYCGHHAQPGVTRSSEALDWTHQESTRDQAHIEAVLETLVVTGTSLLHVGVGNSQLAQRFASRARRIDGLTVSPQEKAHAEALGLPHYTVYVLNKYSPAFGSVLTHTYDFIIDNNLASFACCRAHFSVMCTHYLRALTAHGQIVTCQIGMDAYFEGSPSSFARAGLRSAAAGCTEHRPWGRRLGRPVVRVLALSSALTLGCLPPAAAPPRSSP